MKKASVGVVLFGTRFLECSLPSLIEAVDDDIEILLRDHSPDGAAAKFIREKLPEVAERAQIFVGENLWHSGGMNFLARQADSKFFVAASADATYAPGAISRAIAQFDQPEFADFGSAAAQLNAWLNLDGMPNPEKCRFENLVDTAGIAISRAQHFFEIRKEFDKPMEIFGPSGALAIYRRAAFDAVGGFDERLFYKNDVDLAYRLRWAGWRSVSLPGVAGWHARGVGKRWWGAERGEDKKVSSLFGQLAVVAKNFSPEFSTRTKIATSVRQFGMKNYVRLLESKIWQAANAKFQTHVADFEKENRALDRQISAVEFEKIFE